MHLAFHYFSSLYYLPLLWLNTDAHNSSYIMRFHLVHILRIYHLFAHQYKCYPLSWLGISVFVFLFFRPKAYFLQHRGIIEFFLFESGFAIHFGSNKKRKKVHFLCLFWITFSMHLQSKEIRVWSLLHYSYICF